MTAASVYIGGASAITAIPAEGGAGHLLDHSGIYSTLSIFENLFNAGGGSGGVSGNASALGGVTASNYVTLTGTQTLTNKVFQGPTYATPLSNNNNYFYVSGSVGAVKGYMINSTNTAGGSGSLRWGIYADGTAESTASSGSDFAIARYDNSGNNIGQQISISRLTGLVTMPSANLLSASLNGVPLTTGLFYSPSAQVIHPNNGGTVNAASASLFGAALTVAGNSTYEMELVFEKGTTGSNSFSVDMYFLGTASIASIGYIAMTQTNAGSLGNGPGAGAFIWGKQATSGVTLFNATSNTTGVWNPTFIKGTVRFSSSGTFIPTVVNSASPGATSSVAVGSYIKMVPYGASTVQSVGPWS